MTNELRRQIALRKEYNRKRRNAAEDQVEVPASKEDSETNDNGGER